MKKNGESEVMQTYTSNKNGMHVADTVSVIIRRLSREFHTDSR